MGIIPSFSIKDVFELYKAGSQTEAQETILELKLAALSLQEENLKLREQVKELQDRLSIKTNLIWEPPVYWQQKETARDGPFCQRCWDIDEKLVRLHEYEKRYWRCKHCKSTFLFKELLERLNRK